MPCGGCRQCGEAGARRSCRGPFRDAPGLPTRTLSVTRWLFFISGVSRTRARGRDATFVLQGWGRLRVDVCTGACKSHVEDSGNPTRPGQSRGRLPARAPKPLPAHSASPGRGFRSQSERPFPRARPPWEGARGASSRRLGWARR